MGRIFGGVVAASTLLLACPASAADAYLSLDGLRGASEGGKIELSSISFGSGRAVTSMPLSFGHTLRVSKPVDEASTALWQAWQSGRRFPTAFVSVRSANGTYERYRLADVVISGFVTNGQLSGNQAERFTLNCNTITRA
jgi:type VI protein secretion system component Hcp